MKLYVLGLLTVGLIWLRLAEGAEAPSLLIPIAGSEAAQIEAENEYFLRRDRYFSARDQIVRFDGGLLRNTDVVSLPLFGSDSLVLRRTHLSIEKGGAALYWQGEIIDPTFPVQDLLDQDLSVEQIESIRSGLFTLHFAAVHMTGANNEARITAVPQSDTAIGSNDSDLGTSEFYEVSASFTVPQSGHGYQIIPLEMSPGYHLLLLVDESKTVTEGSSDDRDHPDAGRRRREYLDFLDSLGPAPEIPASIRGNER